MLLRLQTTPTLRLCLRPSLRVLLPVLSAPQQPSARHLVIHALLFLEFRGRVAERRHSPTCASALRVQRARSRLHRARGRRKSSVISVVGMPVPAGTNGIFAGQTAFALKIHTVIAAEICRAQRVPSVLNCRA